MATVTGVHADRVLEIESSAVVDGAVDGAGNLTFTTRGGDEIEAGNVKGPQGDPGPPGGLLDFWPVHSVYISMAPTNPATLFGGTWVSMGAGRVLVGVDPSQEEFNAVGKTGGEKDHLLTTAELPTHSHSINHDHPTFSTENGGTHRHSAIRWSSNSSGANDSVKNDGAGSGSNGYKSTSIDGAHSHQINIPNYTGSSGSAGSSQAHNNLQPYMTCFMWRRTA